MRSSHMSLGLETFEGGDSSSPPLYHVDESRLSSNTSGDARSAVSAGVLAWLKGLLKRNTADDAAFIPHIEQKRPTETRVAFARALRSRGYHCEAINRSHGVPRPSWRPEEWLARSRAAPDERDALVHGRARHEDAVGVTQRNLTERFL